MSDEEFTRASTWVESLLLERAEQVLRGNEPSELGDKSIHVLAATTELGRCAAALHEAGHRIDLFEPEHYRFRLLREALQLEVHPIGESLAEQTTAVAAREQLTLYCQSDPPAEAAYSVGILGLRRDGSAEWSRDLIQLFCSRLQPMGILIVAVDHPDDQWLGDQLRKLARSPKALKRYRSVDERALHGATAYVIRQDDLDLRVRDFQCQFAFRDAGQLIQAISRPGVFSHRRLDLGARRLMDEMVIPAGSHVLDIGCGSGVVGFAAARRDPTVRVTALDSSARAIACTQLGAELNDLTAQIRVHLSSDGTVPEGHKFDIALANPPYFANLRVAEMFLAASHRSLRPGGKIFAVGKQPDWYQTQLPRWFDRVQIHTRGGGYCLATGTRAEST
ncbi:class I SAM-dependent methyltransferase [Planctomycetaceae bacterium SH139]